MRQTFGHEAPGRMIRVTAEVLDARERGRAVVALESTLIAHGLPWPTNLETARESEDVIRSRGAVPATIAVLGGEPRVGLDAETLERLARPGSGVLKASRRDLGVVRAKQADAATTVSATLALARAVGLGVMATGGLGGVHRDAGTSFDVSTDLDELARADGMLLVCSGFKSILDLPATLEALETRGVPVVGFRTDSLPMFTERGGDLKLSAWVDSVEEAAAVVEAHRGLRLPGAVVLAQPVPEGLAVDPAIAESAREAAEAEAHKLGLRGPALTPFLLGRIREATAGASLRANRALIVANAALAAEVAVRLAGGHASTAGSVTC